jgi:hypothetical protein
MEQRIEAKLETMDRKIDARLETMEQRIEAKLQEAHAARLKDQQAMIGDVQHIKLEIADVRNERETMERRIEAKV